MSSAPDDLPELERLRTALRESQDRAERTAWQVRARQRMAEGLARDRTAAQMVETVLGCTESVGAPMGYVATVKGEDAAPAAAHGALEDALDRIHRVSLDAGPAADAVRDRVPVATASREDLAERYPRCSEVFATLGIEASMTVPVEVDHEVVATISVHDTSPRTFGDHDRELLGAIAILFGHSLARARGHKATVDARASLERAMSRLARLQSVTAALTPQLRTDEVAETIVREVVAALGADSAGLFVADGDALRPLARTGAQGETSWDGADEVATGSPLAIAEAYRTASTIWVPSRAEWRRRYPSAPADYHQGAEAVLAVPLVTEASRVHGVLGVLFEQAHALTRDERRLATTIGQQASQALERARLFEAERRLAQRTAGLQEVAAAFAAATSAVEVAEVLVGQGAHALGARAAAVALVDPDGGPTRLIGRNTHDDGMDPAGWITSDEPSPGVDSMASRGTIWIESVAAARERYPALAGGLPNDHGGAWATLPLLNDAGAMGFVHLAFDSAEPLRDERASELRTIAAQASLAIDRARLFALEHEVARVLQASMLARETIDIDAVTVATRYEAGADHLEVGGDWFDVIPLHDRLLGLAIGDVVGRGLNAAAAMGQLRSALRALALQELGPASVVDALEGFAERTPGAAMATVMYGELQLDTGEFRFCCAGHPPPVMETAGRVEVLEEGRSPLLAAGATGPRAEAAVHVPIDATLVLYTDGLVERRGELFDLGIQRLRRALSATVGLDLESRSDEILQRMLDGIQRDDDVALLCVSRTSSVHDRFAKRIDADPAALAPLRHQMDTWLRQRRLDDAAIRSVVLATNEAAANAIEHGQQEGTNGVEVEAWATPSTLTVVVRDTGTWRHARKNSERGQGLRLMRACMDTIAIERSPAGTTVRMHRSIDSQNPTSAGRPSPMR